MTGTQARYTAAKAASKKGKDVANTAEASLNPATGDTPVKSPPKKVSKGNEPASNTSPEGSIPPPRSKPCRRPTWVTTLETCSVVLLFLSSLNPCQANAKLREDLKAAAHQASAASHEAPKATNAKGKGKGKGKPKAKAAAQQPVDPEPEPSDDECTEGDEVVSEAAKSLRLRRLCEKKPSGKINVPMDVHNLWLQGGQARRDLQDALEEAGWDKARSPV